MATQKLATKKNLTLPTFMDLAQEGFTVLREQSQLFFKLVLVAYLPSLAVMMVLQYVIAANTDFLLPDADPQAIASTWMVEDGYNYLMWINGLGFIAGIWQLFMTVVIAYAAGLYFLDRKKLAASSIADLARYCVSKLASLVVTHFIAGIAVAGLFILLIIPGIIYSIYWMFLVEIILFANLTGTEAMARSKALVEGRWWQMFRYTVGFGFLALAITLAVQWGIQSLVAALPFEINFLAYSLQLVSQFLLVALTISSVSLYFTLNVLGPVKK